jgi:hypothetical protein
MLVNELMQTTNDASAETQDVVQSIRLTAERSGYQAGQKRATLDVNV